MALPGDSAIDLRRKLKTNHRVLNTPVVGMIVMGDQAAQKKALDAGFADCITKPFDQNKTDAVMYKVMNLDSSARYFKFIDDYLLFKLPTELSPFVINDINENMDQRIRNTINEGILKIIIDVSSLEEVEEEAIEVVGEFSEKIEDMKLPMRGRLLPPEKMPKCGIIWMVAKNGLSVKTSKKPRNPSTVRLRKTRIDSPVSSDPSFFHLHIPRGLAMPEQLDSERTEMHFFHCRKEFAESFWKWIPSVKKLRKSGTVKKAEVG